jgi:hypothetical protein
LGDGNHDAERRTRFEQLDADAYDLPTTLPQMCLWISSSDDAAAGATASPPRAAARFANVGEV